MMFTDSEKYLTMTNFIESFLFVLDQFTLKKKHDHHFKCTICKVNLYTTIS